MRERKEERKERKTSKNEKVKVERKEEDGNRMTVDKGNAGKDGHHRKGKGINMSKKERKKG